VDLGTSTSHREQHITTDTIRRSPACNKAALDEYCAKINSKTDEGKIPADSATPQGNRRGQNLRSTLKSKRGTNFQKTQRNIATPKQQSKDVPTTFGAAKRKLNFGPSTSHVAEKATTDTIREAPAFIWDAFRPVPLTTEENSDHTTSEEDAEERFLSDKENLFYDDIFDIAMPLIVEAITKVSENKNTQPTIITTVSKTIILDAPMLLFLDKFQDDIRLAATNAKMKVCFVNALPGQTRLNGYVHDLACILGTNLTLDHLIADSDVYKAISEADVFVVDNSHHYKESDLLRFQEVVSFVKFGDTNIQLDDRVVFILIGDEMQLPPTQNENTRVFRMLKDNIPAERYGRNRILKRLPNNARIDSNLSSNALPTEHISTHLDKLIELQKNNKLQSDPSSCHRDNIIKIHVDGGHVVVSMIENLLNSALQACETPDELLQLSCYDVSSFNMPQAQQFYKYLSYGKVALDPDYRTGKKLDKLSRVKQR
jgi:hypothetical protein